MTLNARDFTLPGQWAKAASTTIPPIPISEQAYRQSLLTKALIELGQQYDIVADSAKWNQILYLATGFAMETEVYGWSRWSPLTNYVGNASFCLGTDGEPYRAVQDSGYGEDGISGVGPKDPTKSEGAGYWKSLRDYIGGLPQPYGDDGTVLTVINQESGNIGWRMASVPRNERIYETSGSFTPVATGLYEVLALGGGGGGAGGCGTISTGAVPLWAAAGGGGGSGFTNTKVLLLEEGVEYPVIVGAGGIGGIKAYGYDNTVTAGKGGNGGNSIFGNNLVVAKGGYGPPGGSNIGLRSASGGGGGGICDGLIGQYSMGYATSMFGGQCPSALSYADKRYGQGGTGGSCQAAPNDYCYNGQNGGAGIVVIRW